jgi:DNA-binding winged helix-turn-helix (wHTH) protein
MKTVNTSRKRSDRRDSRLVGADSRKPESRSAFMRLAQHQHPDLNTLMPPALRGETAEILADMNGMSVLVRFRLKERSAEALSTDGNPIRNGADFRLRLSSALEQMVDLMRGSSPQGDDPSRWPPLAKIGPISGGETSSQPRVRSDETVLRVGSLELDLIDRTAKRGDRHVDLRPREFELLKYMMQRSDTLLTRASLFKDVWHYKFVPESNLVDVHMGRLRRKVDASNDPPMIRNVRGSGFVLSTTPISLVSATIPAQHSIDPVVADRSARSEERTLQ